MKPILFNTEMVRGVLDGRKTVTRRVVKPQPTGDGSKPEELKTRPGCWNAWGDDNVYRQPYAPGDILWVRETWAAWSPTYGVAPKLYYKADGDAPAGIKWHPSIYMPKEAARIFLRVTHVRVERLQDITPEQIDAEGCNEFVYSAKTGEPLPSGPSWFKIAWDKTVPKHPNKFKRYPYYWDDNPWVWVIEFERISKEEALGGGGDANYEALAGGGHGG